jgi:hypothetical protein
MDMAVRMDGYGNIGICHWDGIRKRLEASSEVGMWKGRRWRWELVSRRVYQFQFQLDETAN